MLAATLVTLLLAPTALASFLYDVIRPTNSAYTQPDPYVATPRYTTFPWKFETDRTYVFAVAPVKEAPTHPKAYSGYPQLPGWKGGNGLLGIIHYSDSPIGTYSEIMYGSGSFAPEGCSSSAYSISRIWVDSPFSMRAGRNIWGIPKELAIFEWTEEAGIVSVTAKDPQTDKVFFQVTLVDIPIPRPLLNKGLQLADFAFPDCLSTLQWPVDDNTGKTPYANVSSYAVAQAAKASTPMLPIQSSSCFGLQNSVVSKVHSQFIDPEVFTGRADESVTLIPVAVRLPAGTTTTMDLPTPLTCQQGSTASRSTASHITAESAAGARAASASSIPLLKAPFLFG